MKQSREFTIPKLLLALFAGTLLTLAVAAFPAPDLCRFQKYWYLFLIPCGSTALAFIPGRGRLVRILLFIPLLIFFLSSRFISLRTSAEASAVATLNKVNLELQAYKSEHPSIGYPESIASIECPCYAKGYYSFQYMADHAASGGTRNSFVVYAIPVSPSHNNVRSFAIMENGRVFYTTENRLATRRDTSLAEQ